MNSLVFFKQLKYKRSAPAVLLSVAAICIIITLAIRNCGLYPTVFSDEWLYSKFSRLAPISGSPYPSYLYLLLFGISRYCGEGFLECARILNACFFAFTLPFIYLSCRRVASRTISLFVAVLSVLGPINSYSAYFMPEAMYFFSFWLFFWFLLSSTKTNPFLLGAGAGSILGLMALIKLHAIFLIPGFCCFVLLAWITSTGNQSLKDTILTIAWSLLAFFVIRFFVGYIIAGDPGLNLLGGTYGSIARAAAAFDTGQLLSVLRLAKHSLIGHLLALSVLFTVPLATIVAISHKGKQNGDESCAMDNLRRLQIFGIAFLPPLLLVVAWSTAQFVGNGPYETVARLHLRYYNFIFPLFPILAAAQLKSTGRDQIGWRSAWFATLVLSPIALYSIVTGLKNYTLSIVDNPDLAFMSNAVTNMMLGILGLIALVIWAINKKWGASIYLLLFLPLVMLTSAYYVNRDLRVHIVANLYDDAGQFAHRYLGNDASRLLVAGSDLAGLYRALFQVDNPMASVLEIPERVPLELSKIPTGTTWVLLIGNHEPPSKAGYQTSMGEFSLIRVSADEIVDFRNHAWPGILTKIRGVSDPESFGRWSDADQVVMEFAFPLTRRFTVALVASAFGPNVDQPFKIRIGQDEQLFRLSASPKEVSMTFNSTGTERTVVITIPKPITPKELGMGSGDRRLGIALHQLRIANLAEQ
jgi:phosphoglycerol transferase